jgi:hypothetical protein
MIAAFAKEPVVISGGRAAAIASDTLPIVQRYERTAGVVGF